MKEIKAKKKRYETISDALKTKKGQKMYEVLSQTFDFGLALSNVYVKQSVHGPLPCYLGSEDHIGRMVFELLNKV